MRQLRPLCDKIGRSRVEAVINSFYEKLLNDTEIGHFFADLDDIGAHQSKIVEFWWVAMGGRSAAPPTVDMVDVHRRLGITEADLGRWLELFDRSLHERLPDELAASWSQMAHALASKLRGWGVVGP